MSYTFKLSEEPSMVYNDLRLAGKTTDAVIVAEGVEFKVHKLILCDFAQYFR